VTRRLSVRSTNTALLNIPSNTHRYSVLHTKLDGILFLIDVVASFSDAVSLSVRAEQERLRQNCDLAVQRRVFGQGRAAAVACLDRGDRHQHALAELLSAAHASVPASYSAAQQRHRTLAALRCARPEQVTMFYSCTPMPCGAFLHPVSLPRPDVSNSLARPPRHRQLHLRAAVLCAAL
jgi:hypothetical protein